MHDVICTAVLFVKCKQRYSLFLLQKRALGLSEVSNNANRTPVSENVSQLSVHSGRITHFGI